MGYSKRLLMEQEQDLSKVPSHLEKEMMDQIIRMRRQLTAIQQILEVKNDKKHTDDSNDVSNDRL